MATYTVSKDGKTISVGGKTYSVAAFKSQFKTEPGVPLNSGAKGYAAPKKDAKAPTKINTNPKPSAGKTVIGPLAKGVGSGGVAGLALGAVAAYKAELKATAEAKKKKNRMN
jgi:predicted lipid-binding transport protein (Tim44 family)